jgi:hypothetical protein
MAEKTKPTPPEEQTRPAEAKPVLKPVSIRTTGAMRFFRAGQQFGRLARTVDDYTPEQLTAWQEEPFLIVELAD